MARLIVSLTLALAFLPLGAAERRVPTIDDLLNLQSWGEARPDFLSPPSPKGSTSDGSR